MQTYCRRVSKIQSPQAKAPGLHPADHQPLTPSPSDVRAALSRVNARKAAGPDGVHAHVLRACAVQLTEVWTDIFNLSLAQAAVPKCFKITSIMPAPKHSTAASLNDFRPVALTPIITKCFERLVLVHLKASLPPTLDPYQFAHRMRLVSSATMMSWPTGRWSNTQRRGAPATTWLSTPRRPKSSLWTTES